MVTPFEERCLKAAKRAIGLRISDIIASAIEQEAKRQKTTKTKVIETILIKHFSKEHKERK